MNYTVEVECDARMLPGVERQLKAMVDTMFQLISPLEVGVSEDEYDGLYERATVVVTDEGGRVVA